MTVQWFALLFYGVENGLERQRENQAHQRLAGLVEATVKAAQADDFHQATEQLVETFRALTGCHRVALATLRWGQIRLQAVSGTQDDKSMRGEGAMAMESVMGEAFRSNRELEASGEGISLAPPEVRALLEQSGSAHYWCTPLHDGEKIVGAWLFLWKEPPAELEDLQRLLRSASEVIAAQLKVLQKAKPKAFGGVLRRLWKRASSNQRRLVKTVFIALGLGALAPIPLPVGAPSSLQPEVRRTVSAPFDGILRTVEVEPGQEVEAGQLLAELDDREIRWQLADANARRMRAEKQADAALSAGMVSDSQIARLEAEGLEETAKVLRYRQENLQIRAPMAGRVVRGDLKRSEGAIVRMGEMLFEIGSLDRMLAEIEVEESDVALIRENAPVRLQFDSHPGKRWEAELKLISPRSEFRNGANVFICQAVVDNSEGILRPGGQGRAKIRGPWRPAAWYVLRTPVNWTLRQLP